MRPALYSSQLVLQNGEFIGYNLGYNFYCEHEHDTKEIVQSLNMKADFNMRLAVQAEKLGPIKSAIKLGKIQKKSEALMQRFKNTPFGNYILHPYTQVYIRNIRINNKKLREQNKYNKYLLKDTDYIMIDIEDGICMYYTKKNFANKKVFTEEDIFYMGDYNCDTSCNPGLQLSGQQRNLREYECERIGILGAWGSHGIRIMIDKRLGQAEEIAKSIEEALKRGALAIVYQEPRLFRDRGCGIVIVDRAYGV